MSTIPTNNADDITITEQHTQYDASVKRLLSNKIYLAWILRDVTSEFAGMEIDDIVKCIEGDPIISTIPVKEDMPVITGLSNESKTVNEGTVTFDIRFRAVVPKDNKYITLIINVEAQKNFYPGYSITTRGIFYDARMISSQLSREFEIPDYDGLKKVYSIWICMNAPDYIGNAISVYSMHKTDIIEGIPDKPEEYDKMRVVLVCLQDKKLSDNRLLGMLGVLLSEQFKEAEKKATLKEKYDIYMTKEMEQEVNIMCNLSEAIAEKSKAEGLAEGAAKEKKAFVINMLKEHIPFETISRCSGMDVEKIKEMALTVSSC